MRRIVMNIISLYLDWKILCLLILLMHPHTSITFKDCEFPGISPWSQLNIKFGNRTLGTWKYSDIQANSSIINRSYKEDSIAQYKCEDPGRYILQGSEIRTCRKNGRWNLEIPFCAKSIARDATIRIPGIQDTTWLTDGRIKTDDNGKHINKWPEKYIEIESQYPTNFTCTIYFKKQGHGTKVKKSAELHIGNNSCPLKEHHEERIVFRCENISNSTDRLLFYHHWTMKHEILEIQILNDSVELLDELKKCQIPEFNSRIQTNHMDQSWRSSCRHLIDSAPTKEILDDSKTSTKGNIHKTHPTVSQVATELPTITTEMSLKSSIVPKEKVPKKPTNNQLLGNVMLVVVSVLAVLAALTLSAGIIYLLGRLYRRYRTQRNSDTEDPQQNVEDERLIG